MNLQKHLDTEIKIVAGYPHKTLAKQITCTDGTKLSVQASRTHYCKPREDTGPYSHVEVGFPSIAPPDTWSKYAEEWDKPTDTVYAGIPVELVEEFISEHNKTGLMQKFWKLLGF